MGFELDRICGELLVESMSCGMDGWMDGWNYPKWLFIPIEELGRFKVFFGLLDCLVILGFYI